MKKKIFAIYALMGAMAVSPIFTSCVDSEETDSVVALRNSKAEELKAIAELNNALAASKAAQAAADAALMNAQAEAQKANAKYNEAYAAYYEAQNESAKVALEVTIKQTEADLARIKAEMERAAITLEAELIRQQQYLLSAKQNLENAIKDYDQYEKSKLQNLANEYYWAVNDLQWRQQQLVEAKITLSKLEANLVDAKSAVEKTVAANNQQIALNNIRIETLKKYENYQEDVDKLYQEYYKANYECFFIASEANNSANYEWNQAKNNVDYDTINEAWDEINKDDFNRFVKYGSIQLNGSNYGSSIFDGVFNYEGSWKANSHTYTASDEEEWEYSDWCGETYEFTYELNKDIRELELSILPNIERRKDTSKKQTEELEKAQAEYEKAVKATADAKKAWDEAKEADKDAKKAEYETALASEINCKSNVESLQSILENTNKWIAVYEKGWDMIKNAETYDAALQAKIKAYNDANKEAYAESLTTWEKYVETEIAYSEAQSEYWALQNLYWDANSIKNEIEYLEAANQELLKQNAEAEKLLTYYDGIEMPYEVAIEFQKEIVAMREAVVAAYQVYADEAKAALDAAMPAEEE